MLRPLLPRQDVRADEGDVFAPQRAAVPSPFQGIPQSRRLLLKAGVHGNCIRVLCPLVISDAELDEALDAWEQALESALS